MRLAPQGRGLANLPPMAFQVLRWALWVVLPPLRFSSPTQRISLRIRGAPAKEGDRCPNTVGVGRACRGESMKTSRERSEEKRAEKLAAIREQVEDGSLVIRQMTDAERRRDPPRPVPVKRPGRR